MEGAQSHRSLSFPFAKGTEASLEPGPRPIEGKRSGFKRSHGRQRVADDGRDAAKQSEGRRGETIGR